MGEKTKRTSCLRRNCSGQKIQSRYDVGENEQHKLTKTRMQKQVIRKGKQLQFIQGKPLYYSSQHYVMNKGITDQTTTNETYPWSSVTMTFRNNQPSHEGDQESENIFEFAVAKDLFCHVYILYMHYFSLFDIFVHLKQCPLFVDYF